MDYKIIVPSINVDTKFNNEELMIIEIALEEHLNDRIKELEIESKSGNYHEEDLKDWKQKNNFRKHLLNQIQRLNRTLERITNLEH